MGKLTKRQTQELVTALDRMQWSLRMMSNALKSATSHQESFSRDLHYIYSELGLLPQEEQPHADRSEVDTSEREPTGSTDHNVSGKSPKDDLG